MFCYSQENSLQGQIFSSLAGVQKVCGVKFLISKKKIQVLIPWQVKKTAEEMFISLEFTSHSTNAFTSWDYLLMCPQFCQEEKERIFWDNKSLLRDEHSWLINESSLQQYSPQNSYSLAYHLHYGKGIWCHCCVPLVLIMPASIFTLEFLMAALVGRNHTA